MRVPRSRGVRSRRASEHWRGQTEGKRGANHRLQEEEHHLSVENEDFPCLLERGREEVRSYAFLLEVISCDFLFCIFVLYNSKYIFCNGVTINVN